jgi:glutathione synthase/RimK-type ligase-like ATP-grasp enzyme
VADHSPQILVVSTAVDRATDLVVADIESRGVACTRINTEDFPFGSWLSADFESDAPPTLRYQSGDRLWEGRPTSIWYRRVRSAPRPADVNAGVYDFCLRESRAALVGGVLAMDSRIMSDPAAAWRAEHKPFQLRAAQNSGFRIPRTLISNDPDQIRATYREFGGQMIVKPVRTGYVDLGEEQRAIYTSRVLKEHLEHLDEARFSPSIYQPLIAKRCDVRVTYVGGRLFIAEIDSQTDPAAHIDWRRTSNPQLPHHRAVLPEPIERSVLRLMEDLQLQFGAIDLIRTPGGEYIFLEVNPSGQWLWLDDILDFGITSAVGDWLVGSD